MVDSLGGAIGEHDMRRKSVDEEVERAVAALDVARMRREYWEQDEFVFLDRFLPPAVAAERLVP